MVACCQLEHRGKAAYFGMFAVRPELQGAGLGKVIIAEAEHTAREEWGVGEMHMTVISVRHELIAWYERRGYRRTGELSPSRTARSASASRSATTSPSSCWSRSCKARGGVPASARHLRRAGPSGGPQGRAGPSDARAPHAVKRPARRISG